MSIPVIYPRIVQPKLEYHFATEAGQPMCGAVVSADEWDVGAVAFIVDDVLCPACLGFRALMPSLRNEPEKEVMRCVYILRLLGSNYYKIGVTKNITNRLSDLQHAMPIPIMLVWHSGFYPSRIAFSIERQAHQLYDHLRVKQQFQREWFTLQRRDVKDIQDAIEIALSEVVS